MANDNPRRSHFLGPEDAPYEGGALLHNLLLFGRVCKRLGMDVSPNRMIEVSRGLQWVDLGRRIDVYHALRALIVSRSADLERFDEAFRLFWRQRPEGWTQLDLRSLGEERRRRKTRFLPAAGSQSQDSDSERTSETPVLLPVYSPSETLRQKDFAEMTAAELAAARELIQRLAHSLGRRRTRRMAPGDGPTPDLRAALRRNLRYAGELLSLPGKLRKIKPRPVVLICDVSGSMERYTRILLHFAHTLSNHLSQIESFVFSTRLTRITRAVRHKSIDRALREVSTMVRDWAGGTQTGQALRQFNFRWSRRVLGRGAVTLLISDGWDRGDPDLLKSEADRLQRSCKRLIWLNPLLGAPEYQPLTRGAQALLPRVDDFLSVRNLASLEALGRELERLRWN